MRAFVILAISLCAIRPSEGTTLRQLSLGDMAEQSSAIVRAKVLSSGAVLRGGDVYTVYQFETLESLKPAATPSVHEVAVPGGVAGGIRQVMAGAPALRVGTEYVMFLWTSRSGLTQIIGLSQGLFSVQPDGKDSLVTRASAAEHMVDSAGRTVRDEALAMNWTELKTRVNQASHRVPPAPNTIARGK